MKKNFFIIFLCFIAGLTGANITPIFTGTGKIVFPEASPSSYISSSGGTLTIGSGGTNPTNINLLPLGGAVGAETTDPTFGGKLPAGTAGFVSTYYGAAFAAGSGPTAPNFKLVVDTAGDWATYDYAAAAWTMGLYQTKGTVGIASGPGAGNQLDVAGAGTINALTGYKTNNVAGLSIVKTVRNSANTGTCTMTFSGGILTASTC
jgi:hypothetical protein